MAELDLRSPRRIHLVGIGGAGMSAIATILVRMGHTVTGSDLKPSAQLARMQALGVRVMVGHDPANLPADAEAVAVSSAIPPSNPEVRAARQRGLPVFRRAELLAAVCATRRTLAVAGTHGKTTTSSMLAVALTEAGLEPSFVVGGELNEIGSGAVLGKGEWLVVEADESDGTFLELGAEAALVTNVEPDHLGYWGSFERLVEAFGAFLAAASGPRLVCADDPVASRLGAEVGAKTFGSAPGADFRLVVHERGRAGSRFSVLHHGRPLVEVALGVPGLHNAVNATGALAAAVLLGASAEAAGRALGRFGGVARRFQFRGERGGVSFVDDYAHLPSEVRAALAAARDGGWARVVCVFQPHRYSRTEALWRDFADAFVDADLLAVTDVYAAGEQPRPGVTGRLVVQAVLDAHPDAAVTYVPRRDELVAYLRRVLRPGDLCLTLGAGDLTVVPDMLLGREQP